MTTQTYLQLHQQFSQRKNRSAMVYSSPVEPGSECLTALSPLAYLADLMDYVLKHIKKADDWLTLEELEAYFHQPFGEIPLTCGAMEKEVAQIRICIEVLRKYFDDQNLGDTFITKEEEYLEQTYKTLLLRIGTSYEEMQQVGEASIEKRNKIAEKIGIKENHLDEIWAELVSVKESWLEQIFGLQNTNEVTFSIEEPSLLEWQKEYSQEVANDLFEEDDPEKENWIEERFQQLDANHNKLIQETEEQTLSILREALLSTGMSARQLSNQLLISCEYNSSIRTTRVGQAITTLQQLIVAVRSGTLKDTHPELNLQAELFSEEWKWMGSYNSWRAAMNVFVYPENMLDPSLRREITPKFAQFIKQLRKQRNPNRSNIDDLVEDYRKYFKDTVGNGIAANCQAPAEVTINGITSEEVLFFMFKSCDDRDKIYYSTFFEKDGSTGHHSFWEEIPGFDNHIRLEVIGATPYKNSEGERAIYIFFQGNTHEGAQVSKKIVWYTTYNLNAHTWSGSIDVFDSYNSYSEIRSFYLGLKNGENQAPKIYYKTNGLGVDLHCAEMNETGDGMSEIGWTSISTGNLLNLHRIVELGNHTWLFYDQIHYPNQGDYGYYTGRIETIGGQKEVVHKKQLSFAATRVILIHGSIVLMLSNDNAGQIIANPIWLSDQVQLQAVYSLGVGEGFLYNSSINARGIEYLNAIHYNQNDKSIEIIIFDKNQDGTLTKANSYPIQPAGVDYFDLSASDIPSDLSEKKAKIAAVMQANQGLDSKNMTYLWEAYYFLPIYIALYLSRKRQYTDAKDFFRLVYDYSSPISERKIFYGLSLEENWELDESRNNDWLLDPLDPHTIASNRKNAYTEYTVLSLARIFLKEADEAFAQDTAEKIATARNLYLQALDILENAFPQQLEANRFNIGGRTSGLKLKNLLQKRNKIARDVDSKEKNNGENTVSFFATGALLTIHSFEFIIPDNPLSSLLKLQAEINLYKINSGRNISGEERTITAISTTVTNAANYLNYSGGQIYSNATSQTFQPTPYKYTVLAERAKQLVNLAQQLESSFLNALEKLDAERFNLLEAQNNIQLSRTSIRLQDLRLNEARHGVILSALQYQRTEVQQNHFRNLIEEGVSKIEESALKLMGAGNDIGDILQKAGANFSEMTGGLLESIPIIGSFFGSSRSREIQLKTTLASFERRSQEWEFQAKLSSQDILISQQQQRIASGQVDIIQQERTIASLRSDQAEIVSEFLINKFTNAELYDWMSEVLEGVYSFFLQQATATAQLAAQQLNFERQEPIPSIILSDYWELFEPGSNTTTASNIDRRGLTGAARLLQDIYQLDQYALQTDRRKLQLTKTISLANLSPAEFQRFKDTGKMFFYTPMEMFDRNFPGHYLRLIKRIQVSTIALTSSTEGIKASLWNNGISRVVQPIYSQYDSTIIKRIPESIALTSSLNASGLFEFIPDDQSKLLPFESMGVDTAWELTMPKAANISLNYDTIADILITIDYTALHSEDYKQQVIQRLGNEFSADRAFSFRNEFPDQWYDFNNMEEVDETVYVPVEFEVLRADFPSNLNDIKVQQLVVYFANEDGLPPMGIKLGLEEVQTPTRMTYDGLVSSRHGESIHRWNELLNQSPLGIWSLAIPNNPTVRSWFKEEKIKDILFVITYQGNTASW